MDNPQTLSTITEEPKSLDTSTVTTDSRRHRYLKGNNGSMTSEEGYIESEASLMLPPIPEPLPPRKKRHTSVVLKATSRELIVPHVDTPSRSPSIKDNILFKINTSGLPLFPTVIAEESTPPAPSILVTGFGLRNLASLQDALLQEEHKKLQQLYRTQETYDSSSNTIMRTVSSDSQITHSSLISLPRSESTTETQTDAASEKIGPHEKLLYLMGISGGEEESLSEERIDLKALPEEVEIGMSESMKKAQIYLRTHKIFDFFQFIICHLLSALPENPIEFIIELLDKCLYYRSGLMDPPLLYGYKHLDSLFYLMDKMRTDYINLEQYKIGMHTVGLCSFNETPYSTEDGLVRKEDFVEEAYQGLMRLLDDMIRIKYIDRGPPVLPPPPPTPQISSFSSADEFPSMPFLRSHIFVDI